MSHRLLSRRVITASCVIGLCLLGAAFVSAQSTPYNSTIERQLWKQLLPWGLNLGANEEVIWADRKDLNNIPSSGSKIDTEDVDEYFDPIYRSIGPYGSPTYPSMDAANVEFGRLIEQGECTFSHAADYDIHWSIYWPQVRICKGPEIPGSPGEFAKLPPGPGRLLNPVGIAISGSKVFVTDLFNHRVQAFDFYGNHLPMKFPIGNGIPGSGTYDYDALYPWLNYRPYASNPGFENFGFSGHQLSGPAGIAVDARKIGTTDAPRLLIADSDNYRVALFNDDGTPAFGTTTPVHVTLPIPADGGGNPILPDVPANQFKPDQIAISPGAVIRDPSVGAPILEGDPDYLKRIVVADRVHCYLAIMDVGFNVIKTLPPTLPALTQHDACQDNQENTNPPLPGEFSTITGVKVDSNGTIYVADHASNVIRVFDRNGNPIASIGEPGGSNPGGVGALKGPVGVFIDEQFGRLGVIDEGHARAVFYNLANGPANVTFSFQIDTTVAVDDFPMGVAMQFGPESQGLDPKGRIMVTDPIRRRVLRWELPELVIANATATVVDSVASPKTGTGSFDVVVPFQKLSPVLDVIVDVQPAIPGVTVVPGSIVPDLSILHDIQHGQLVHYTFQFTTTVDEAQFLITARGDCDAAGDNCLAEAPDAAAVARALCDDCRAEASVHFPSEDMDNPDAAVLIPTPPARVDPVSGRTVTGWYNQPVFVRIRPVVPVGTSANDPNRVVKIGWTYGGVSDINYEPTLTEVEVDVDGVTAAPYIDIPVAVTGVSWVTYQAITLGGSASAPIDIDLPLDLTAPSMLFTGWTAPTGVDGVLDWYNVPVTGTYQLLDPHSGPKPATAEAPWQVTFDVEGRSQFVLVTPQDRVDNQRTSRSDDISRSGKPVNIDYGAPYFPGEPLAFELAATHADALGDYVNIPAGRFAVDATDPILGDGSPGSRPGTWGVFNEAKLKVRNGDTIRFVTTDNAGNTGEAFAVITVTDRPIQATTASIVGGTFTYDGQPHAAQCTITGEDGVTFPGTLTYATGQVPTNAGTVMATCSFDGDAQYASTTPVSADVIILKATPTVVTTGGTFMYDGLAHGSTCTVTGVPGETLTGVVTYGAPGTVPLNFTPSPIAVRCDFAETANYHAAFATNQIVINKRPITIRTTSRTITIGDPIPAFPYALAPGSLPLVGSDSLAGLLGVPAGLSVGTHAVTVDTSSLGPNYQVTVQPATLTILPVNVPPVAIDDAVSSVGAAPVTINVTVNDSDPDGGVNPVLTVVAFTQPLGGVVEGTVTQSGNLLVFTPAPTFVGTATFTYTIRDARGGEASANVVVTITAPTSCDLAGYTTFTQGGWGAVPRGNNPAALLQSKFSTVYPSGAMSIGGDKTLTFLSSSAIGAFLPAGGTAGVLTSSATNPTSSAAGVFAGQVLALQLNVDFSVAGVTKRGLGDLVYDGRSVYQILALANQVLGGNVGALAGTGWSLSQLNSVVDGINNNFDGGTRNDGMLSCPSGSTTCVPASIHLTGNSSTSGTVGNIRAFSGGGVLVRASAFSRDKSNGAWNTAFLGAFGSAGLGVTDGSEGSGANDTHKLDNIGDRLNYILLEFSKPVVVSRAYLASVGSDSDLTVWLANRAGDPYTNHLTLSDAVLGQLGAPISSTTTSSSERWASFNDGQVLANVMVIAADVTDTTPEDAFKLAKLEIACPGPNRPPTVTAAAQTHDEGASVSVQIAGSDPDHNALTYSATGLPPGLSINAETGLITGSIGYAADRSYNVTITVEDAGGLTSTASFVWTVHNKNRPPAVTAADRTDGMGAAVAVQIAGSDPDGDTISYTATGLPPGLSITAAGLIAGTPTTAGTYFVTVTVKDPSNASASTTFCWIITSPNRPPTVTAAHRTDNRGTAVSVQIAGSDPDGDALTFTATGLPPGVSISSSGKITGTLTTAGTFTVTVTVKDPSQASASATFTWTVKSANVAPDANNDSASTSKNTSKTIAVLANDSDPNGDALRISSVTQPSKGSVTANANGTITFSPRKNWLGTTTFAYTISDGNGGTDTATVTVTVGSHTDSDDCDRDHDHDGDRDDDDDRERDCDRDHRHTRDCDRDRDRKRR